MVDGKLQSHVVRFNEILTEVTLPAPQPGFKASFEKLRPRGVWDFAMASLALGLVLQAKQVQDARVVFGGIVVSLAGKTGRGLSEGQDAQHAANQSSDGARCRTQHR